MTQSTKLIRKSNIAMQSFARAEGLTRRLQELRLLLNDSFAGQAELAVVLGQEILKLEQVAKEQREVYRVYRSNAEALERDSL